MKTIYKYIFALSWAFVLGAFAASVLWFRVYRGSIEFISSSYENKIQSVSAELSAVRSELAEASEVVKLSRYYASLARAAGCANEPSALLVMSVLTAVLDADKNRCGFSADDIMSLLLVESCYSPRAKSQAGAIGLGQIMPKTAADYGVSDPKRLYEPDLSIELTIRILNDYAQKYNCDKRLALLSYNRGPNRVSKDVAFMLDPSNGYDDKIIRYAGL